MVPIFSVAAPNAVAVVELQAAVQHVQRQGPVVVSCDDISKGMIQRKKVFREKKLALPSGTESIACGDVSTYDAALNVFSSVIMLAQSVMKEKASPVIFYSISLGVR